MNWESWVIVDKYGHPHATTKDRRDLSFCNRTYARGVCREMGKGYKLVRVQVRVVEGVRA
jgi:hypothetical protein